MAASHLALEAVISHEHRTVARCLLRRGRYVIGQERKNEIVADAPSISSKHARLTVVNDEQFFLEDLGSSNGTRVDGAPINGTTEVTLDSEIYLGEARLTFQRGGLPATVFQYLPANFLRSSRYAIGEAMVKGRTSTIFEAQDTILGRTVAVKVLRPDQFDNTAQVVAFIRDAQLAAQLSHSGILPVFDLGLDEEIGLFTATRFIEGESLASVLEGLTAGAAEASHATFFSLLQVFMRACDAVGFAHARGVVHTAIRPEAIIFGRFGEVFVDHWGFAKIIVPEGAEEPVIHVPDLDADQPVSRYITPEQAAGTAGLDPRTDVYALGALLFRLLTLRNFNAGETEESLLAQALAPARPPLEALAAQPPPAHIPGGKIPERLAAACARALSFAREDRFPTAHELKREVALWLECIVAGGEQSKIWKQLASLVSRH